MIGSPEFIITNIKDLNNFAQFTIKDIGTKGIPNVEISEVNRILTYNEYINKAEKYLKSAQDDSGFILTSKELKLLSLEHVFGEEFSSPTIKMTISDPERKFEKAVFKASVESAKALNTEVKQFYIAFGIGDDLRYWSNFLEGSLIMVKRTQDHLSTKNIYLEFIPAFGISDLFSEKIKSSFENKEDRIGKFEYKVIMTPPDLGGDFNSLTLGKAISEQFSLIQKHGLSPYTLKNFVNDEEKLKQKYDETLARLSDLDVEPLAVALYYTLFGDSNKTVSTKYTLLGNCISSAYKTDNVIFAFNQNPLSKLVSEEFKKAEGSINDIVYRTRGFLGFNNEYTKAKYAKVSEAISKSLDALNDEKVSSLQFTQTNNFSTLKDGFLENLGKELKGEDKIPAVLTLKISLTIMFYEIEKFLIHITDTLSEYKDDTTPIRFLKENDTTLLNIWYTAGLISNPNDTCIIMGDEEEILSQLYGISLKGKDTPLGDAIKKLNVFDNSIYGMLEGTERKFLHSFKGTKDIIRQNNIPVLKFNQPISNVVSLEVDDNYAYFGAFTSKINILANYSSFMTQLAKDITVVQYTNNNLAGLFSYYPKFYGGAAFGEHYSPNSAEERVEGQFALLKLSDLTKLQKGFMDYASKDKDLKFLNYLKSGDLGSARNYFKSNFVSVIGETQSPVNIDKAPTIIIDPKDYASKQDIDEFIDVFFSVIFDKLLNDQTLVYHIRSEIGFNPASYELYMYKDIYNKAFKLNVGTLPMYRLCNLSYMLVPALFLYNESNIAGSVEESDLLSGFYKITGIKHTLSPEEMKTTFILRKTFGEFYGDNRSTSS